jgi:hypothetical protein
VTLKAPVLFGCVVFSVAIITLLEILAKRSSEDVNGGGLVFAEEADSFSLSGTFL